MDGGIFWNHIEPDRKEECTMDVFMARQPILDARRQVFAYELLFRSGEGNHFAGGDGDLATTQVIQSSFMSIGLGDMIRDTRIFINFTAGLLLNRTPLSLPPDTVTVEILENVEPTAEIIAAVREIREAGFMIALDDFLAKDQAHPLLPFADIVKVDFMGTTIRERANIVSVLRRPGLTFLAEKVEDYETFRLATAQGYTLFQGYFFQKPELLSGKALSGNQLSRFRLLAALSQPDGSVHDLSEIIRQDVSLTYKLLKFINTPYFGLKRTVNSIDFAITLLGADQIRRWAALVTMGQIGEEKPSELVLSSLVRGLLCESLFLEKPSSDLRKSSSFFLAGLLSLIDAMVDMPMEQVLSDLPLDPEVRGALTGSASLAKDILDLVVAYEQGRWVELVSGLERTRLGVDRVSEKHRQALVQAQQLLCISR